MVVLEIEVEDFSLTLVDPKRNPPVGDDGEAPRSSAVAAEFMRFPARDAAKLLGVFHLLQEGQNIAYLLDDARSQPRGIIAFDETS